MAIATFGLDLAKNVFQVHGADAEGRAVVKRRLRRSELLEYFARQDRCLVAMESCSGAHYWARELEGLGHRVRLIPPAYVRPYVKTNKNDATDAEAICEAATRPTMRFAPVKNAEQQSVLMLHRARELIVRQRTMIINMLRGQLAEFGFVAAQGTGGVNKLISMIDSVSDDHLPPLARKALRLLVDQLVILTDGQRKLEAELLTWHRANDASRRLETVPGIGPLTATAIVASIGNGRQFASARHFAAWVGLVPRQHSTGGKARLGGISKRGDAYLRRLLIHGARALTRWPNNPTAASPWLVALRLRRPGNVATVALANKTARIAWAVLTRGEIYTSTPAVVAQ